MNKIQMPPPMLNSGVRGTSAPNSRMVTHGTTPVAARDDEGDRSSLELTATASGGPVFDRARVDQIRGDIAAGRYVVDGRAVAHGLLSQSVALQDLT